MSLSNNPSKCQVDILLAQLKELSQIERTILGLFFYEKLNVNEIATVMNWQTQKVENTLQQILPSLTVQDEQSGDTEYSQMELFG